MQLSVKASLWGERGRGSSVELKGFKGLRRFRV